MEECNGAENGSEENRSSREGSSDEGDSQVPMFLDSRWRHPQTCSIGWR